MGDVIPPFTFENVRKYRRKYQKLKKKIINKLTIHELILKEY